MADDLWREGGRRWDGRGRYQRLHFGQGGGHGQSRVSLGYDGTQSVSPRAYEYDDRYTFGPDGVRFYGERGG
jgi:hypothetical protein